jgi:hypothetical protein
MLSANVRITYARYHAKPETYETEAYLLACEGYFGSIQAYQEYKETARAELDANKELLRRSVEPNRGLRPGNTHWKEAQNVFYAWTRRGYEKKLGPDVNIPAVIVAKDSQRLRDALKQVSLRSGHEFKQGTFNPRPEKNPRGYRLGTISEHAFGNAIDIDAEHNPQMAPSVWSGLVAYTQVPANLADEGHRKVQWRTQPQTLYDAIANMSREYSSRVKRALQEQTNAGATTELDAAAALQKQDRELAKIPAKKLVAWKDGFLALPWQLVQALHEAQMLWGATFKTLDLHHFELLPPGDSQ